MNKITPEPTVPAGVSEVAENIAREVMAEMLVLSAAEVHAESRGAQLIREGIRRYVTLRPDPVLEALAQTQWMLETIVRSNSTNFAEVHERIIANRAALQTIEGERS